MASENYTYEISDGNVKILYCNGLIANRDERAVFCGAIVHLVTLGRLLVFSTKSNLISVLTGRNGSQTQG